MDFFAHFAWAVPTAFADALAQCHFDRGDQLYDTRQAYQVWQKAKRGIRHGVRVIRERAAPAQDDEAPDELFIRNWDAPIDIELRDVRKDTRNPISTTQGRLYSLLWKGDVSILDTVMPDPVLPWKLRSAKQAIEKALPVCRRHFESLMDRPNFFVLPYEATSIISFDKYRKFRALLRQLKPELNADVQEWEMPRSSGSELPWDDIAPTISFRCLAMDTEADQQVRQAVEGYLLREAITRWEKRMKRCQEEGKKLPKKPKTASFKRHGRFVSFRMP